MKRKTMPVAAGLIVVGVFLLHAIGLMPFGFFKALETMSYDARIVATMPGEADPSIVIVDVDEKSLAAEGRWPWGRDKIATLVTRLVDDYAVSVVAFDMVFAERDESSGLGVMQALARNELKAVPQFHSALTRLEPQLDRDNALARDIQGRPVVLGYYFNDSSERRQAHAVGALPEPIFAADEISHLALTPLVASGYGANLPILQHSATAAGHFSQVPDLDGILRRVPMLMSYEGAWYECCRSRRQEPISRFRASSPWLQNRD